MKWITRERPKIDRIACPWLITRFVDKSPEFLYVPADEGLKVGSPAAMGPETVGGGTGQLPCVRADRYPVIARSP